MFLLCMFEVVGLLFIGLGVPLFVRAVPPNGWYGFRTPRTLSDKAVWYPVNRVTGAWCIVTGVGACVVAALVYRSGVGEDTAAGINIAALMGGLLIMVVHGVVVLRRLTR